MLFGKESKGEYRREKSASSFVIANRAESERERERAEKRLAVCSSGHISTAEGGLEE